MKRLVLESWLLLLYLDVIMHARKFSALHETVRDCKIDFRTTSKDQIPSEMICRAMDLACVFYFKHALCLQRSAATTIVMRRHGHKAEMIIGVQMTPFKSHAWVEIGNTIVNDKPYMLDIYRVLDRC